MNVEYLLTRILHVTDQIKSNKMDAALLAEREAFKRRAMAVPTIENKKRKIDIGTAAKSGSGAKPPAGSSGDKGPSSSAAKFKGVSGSQYKFGVLARSDR